jgi:hypothetical protein
MRLLERRLECLRETWLAVLLGILLLRLPDAFLGISQSGGGGVMPTPIVGSANGIMGMMMPIVSFGTGLK